MVEHEAEKKRDFTNNRKRVLGEETLVNGYLRELDIRRHESKDIPVFGKQESFLAQGRGFIEVIGLHPHCSDQRQEEMRAWSETTGAHLFKALGSDTSRHPSH